MHRFVVSLLLLGLPASLAWAEKEQAADLARDVAPFVDERTVAVGQVDLAGLDLAGLQKLQLPLLQVFGPTPATPPAEIGKAVAFLKQAGVRRVCFVFSITGFPQEPPLLVLLADQGTDRKELAQKLTEGKLFGALHFEARNETVVGGSDAALERLGKLKAKDRPEFARDFEALGDGVAHVVVTWPGEGQRIVEETLPRLPEALGGGSSKVLTQGLKWLGVRVTAKPKVGLSLIVQAADNDSAADLKQLLDKALALAGKEEEIRGAVPNFDKVVRLLTPEVRGDRLVLQVEGEALAQVLQQPLEKVRNAAERAQSINNLKQLALAMHNYHDVHKSFPAWASFDKQGKPLLSLRVHLLPYLAQEKLYKEFHLDEPWDSEHNKKLLARMPGVFAVPGTKPLDGKTTYLVPVGADTVFAGMKGMKIADITDGTSNTILLVEADNAHAVPWTKPEDLKFDPKNPERGLGFKYGNTFLAAICDGSVRGFKKMIDPKMLKALFTPRGGEVVEGP